MLVIIENTAGVVDQTILTQYRGILSAMLGDKVPNIRVLAITVASAQPTLVDKTVGGCLGKLKEDTDQETRMALKTIKI